MGVTRRRVAIASLIVLVGLGAYLLGVRNAERANWHSVTVDLASVASDDTGPRRLLSIDVDGWTYAIRNDVRWIDTEGTRHENGWPECLEPRHPGFTARNHEKVTFSFAEVSVDTGHQGWRPVVMVDCGDAAS